MPVKGAVGSGTNTWSGSSFGFFSSARVGATIKPATRQTKAIRTIEENEWLIAIPSFIFNPPSGFEAPE